MEKVLIGLLIIIILLALESRARARRAAELWKREAKFQEKMYLDEKNFWDNYIISETNKKIEEVRKRKHGHGLN